MRCVLLLCSVLLSAAAPICAQSAADEHAPDAMASTFVPGVEVAPIPGLPFTADEKIIWTRPVEGGGTITSSLISKIVRDRQGRVYRERHHFGPATLDAAASMYQFYILDPVAKTATICLRPQRVCHIVPLNQRPTPPLQPVGPFNGGKEYLARQTLGSQIVQDLQLTGTQESIAVQPGTFGNDQVLTLTREFWYSPDLQINLSVLRKDPRTGTQDVRVTLVSRTDPEPDAFAIPAGYRIEDNRPSASHTGGRPAQ